MPRGAKAKPRRASVKRAATPAGKNPPAAARLVLQADCTLRQATTLKTSLLELQPGAQGATLDGSAVQRIDTAGLQLLAAFAQGETKAGRPLAWSGASPVLREASSRLGLAAVLSLPAGTDARP
ncbi:MAG: STAS domain-containing protein [Pseudomonadota bacterium]|nr:STAS domain-containing protein [Pseudomonadota bacterium]